MQSFRPWNVALLVSLLLLSIAIMSSSHWNQLLLSTKKVTNVSFPDLEANSTQDPQLCFITSVAPATTIAEKAPPFAKCNTSFCGLDCESCCADVCCTLPSCRRIVSVVNYGTKLSRTLGNLDVAQFERDRRACSNRRLPPPPDGSWAIPRNMTIYAAEPCTPLVQVHTGWYLVQWSVRHTMAVRVADRKVLDISAPKLREKGVAAQVQQQYALLARYNVSDATWRFPPGKKVFCMFPSMFRAGHKSKLLFTMLGSYYLHFGNQTQDVIIALQDPSENNRAVNEDTYMMELVLWVLRYMNQDVVFLRSSQIVLGETVIFAEPIDGWNVYYWAFKREVIFPAVAISYASFPTYERVAFIKTAALGKGRGFSLSDAFTSQLKAAGFHLVSPKTPMAERMWYVNKATWIIVSVGSLRDIILRLRVSNFTSVKVLILVHSGYVTEFNKWNWTSCSGTIGYYVSTWNAFDGSPYRLTTALHVAQDFLDILTPALISKFFEAPTGTCV